MEVCIIGGGFNGIYAAKCCIDNKLTPFLLNKYPSTGGIWLGLPGELGVWSSMHTNTSKYLLGFSDMLWKAEDPDFPHHSQVLEYFQAYSTKHNLDPYIHNNCEVILVENSENGYLVRWKSGENISEKIFGGVIVATGKYSIENLHFDNSKEFAGMILSAGVYRTPDIFTGKKVVVIGNTISGPDIALEALQTAASVSLIYRRKNIYVAKYDNGLPRDFPYFIVDSPSQMSLIPNLTEHSILYRRLIHFNNNPGIFLPEWEIDESTLNTEFYGISVCKEEFLSAISERRIHAIQGNVKSLYENGIVLSNGQHIEAEVIVNGSGYSADYPFLSEEIKKIIQFSRENILLPRVLYRYILHPDLPRMCFLGSPVLIPGRFELPAEIGVKYIAGNLKISREEMEQGLKDEEFIRTMQKDGLKSPYGFGAYFYECLRILGLQLDKEFIIKELQFGKGPILPYFLHTETEEQREICRKAVQEIKEKFPFYDFS